MKRCDWVPVEDDLYTRYHDEEWGVPLHDDRRLFEMLVLEGAQAGLSWSTVLKKRENYRIAFEGFYPEKVAVFDEERIGAILADPGVIRNRSKVRSAIRNAKVFMEIQKEFGSFDEYIWGFVDGIPIRNEFREMKEIPAKTPLSERISRDMKQRGMNFVGPTIIYALMQSIGMVNDHQVNCFRYREICDL